MTRTGDAPPSTAAAAAAAKLGLVLKAREGWQPTKVPQPRAHDPALTPLMPKTYDESLYTTASPAYPRQALTSQPEFFRLVVPPIFVDVPAPKAVGRFADSPSLRQLVDAELRTLVERFSPARSIESTPAATIEPMPVVKDVGKRLRPNHFESVELIAVQHLYGSTVGLIDEMLACGLDAKSATVIGKSYSTSYGAARALKERGVNVPLAPLEQHPLESHDEVMKREIHAQLTRISEKLDGKRAAGEPLGKILVLDDGGQIIETLHEKFSHLLPYVKAVEQTTRGIRKVDELAKSGELKCSVKDVARSWVKLQGEMPLIGLSVFYEVRRKLLHLETCGYPPGNVVSLIGYGSVGREVARAFREAGYRVRVLDPALDAKNPPPGIDVISDRTKFLEGANILVSVTGAAPLTVDDYKHLPNRAALFNGASSNDELAAKEAIGRARDEQPPRMWWDESFKNDKQAYLASLPELLLDREYALPDNGWLWGELNGSVIPLGNVARRARRDRVLHFEDKDIFLANSGFVVNLTDELDPIPPHLIQVTRAALLAACAEGIDIDDDAAPDVQSISEEEQQRIWHRYQQPDGAGAAGSSAPTWTPGWTKHAPRLATPRADALEVGATTMPKLAPMFARATKAFFLSPAHVLHEAVEK